MMIPFSKNDLHEISQSLDLPPGNTPKAEDVVYTPPPPKKRWYQKLADAVGEAIGQAKFGS